MFKFVLIGLFAIQCNAVPLNGGYGGGLGLGLAGGYTSGGGLVPAAIISQHYLRVIPVASSRGIAAPSVIDIESEDQPVVLNFNSRSSSLLTTQNHYGQPGSVQQDSSTDEPHRLIQEIVRPVIQEVREVIVPSRKVIQEIRPVEENIQTNVAKGEGRGVGGGLSLGGLGRGVGGSLALSGGSLGLGSFGGGYGGNRGLVSGGLRGYGGGQLLSAGGGFGSGLAFAGGYGKLSKY